MNSPLSSVNLTNIFCVSSKDPSRIINREGRTMEFKESYNHCNMAQYFKTMASFANNQGGYILFGIGDKPRRLLGLKGKSLSQFEELKVEEFTKALLDYFSPEIKWEHRTFEFNNLSFGVIYVHQLIRKPCICRKCYDAKNIKYSLKEGDIYYRYSGRSERIRYAELASIVDGARRYEEHQWLNFLQSVVRIGVSNAALLDLKSGKLSGSNGSIVIDEKLLQKISLIQEGKFVETGGRPTLRLIGDITKISTGKVVIKEMTRKVERSIDPNDIICAFLENKQISEPLEYIKRICSATSANYPIYFFIKRAFFKTSEVISLIRDTTSRGVVKSKLIERLEGKIVPQTSLPSSTTSAGKKKEWYRQQWLNESVPEAIEDVGYCIDALRCLSKDEFTKHDQYIRLTMLRIYNDQYENSSSTVASKIRQAICQIDEALYLE